MVSLECHWLTCRLHVTAVSDRSFGNGSHWNREVEVEDAYCAGLSSCKDNMFACNMNTHGLSLACTEAFTLHPGSFESWFWVSTNAGCFRTGTSWRKVAGSSWRGSPSPPPPSCRKMEAISVPIMCCVVCLEQNIVLSQKEESRRRGWWWRGNSEQWLSVSVQLMTGEWVENAAGKTFKFHYAAETAEWHSRLNARFALFCSSTVCHRCRILPDSNNEEKIWSNFLYQ